MDFKLLNTENINFFRKSLLEIISNKLGRNLKIQDIEITSITDDIVSPNTTNGIFGSTENNPEVFYFGSIDVIAPYNQSENISSFTLFTGSNSSLVWNSSGIKQDGYNHFVIENKFFTGIEYRNESGSNSVVSPNTNIQIITDVAQDFQSSKLYNISDDSGRTYGKDSFGNVVCYGFPTNYNNREQTKNIDTLISENICYKTYRNNIGTEVVGNHNSSGLSMSFTGIRLNIR